MLTERSELGAEERLIPCLIRVIWACTLDFRLDAARPRVLGESTGRAWTDLDQGLDRISSKGTLVRGRYSIVIKRSFLRKWRRQLLSTGLHRQLHAGAVGHASKPAKAKNMAKATIGGVVPFRV
jgi:hypothetical protein